MTTREKIVALVEHVRTLPKSEASGELGNLLEMLAIVRGITRVDPLAWLIPETDAEADLYIDKVIGLLLELRGDDLPPFEPSRFGEVDDGRSGA